MNVSCDPCGSLDLNAKYDGKEDMSWKHDKIKNAKDWLNIILYETQISF